MIILFSNFLRVTKFWDYRLLFHLLLIFVIEITRLQHMSFPVGLKRMSVQIRGAPPFPWKKLLMAEIFWVDRVAKYPPISGVIILVGAQPPPCCWFACHLVKKMVIWGALSGNASQGYINLTENGETASWVCTSRDWGEECTDTGEAIPEGVEGVNMICLVSRKQNIHIHMGILNKNIRGKGCLTVIKKIQTIINWKVALNRDSYS